MYSTEDRVAKLNTKMVNTGQFISRVTLTAISSLSRRSIIGVITVKSAPSRFRFNP